MNEILIEGRFEEEMAKKFKNDLRKYQYLPHSTIYVRIRSWGGEVQSMALMNAYVYFLSNWKGCKFIALIEYAESAALLFAVNMHRRIITKKSCGRIHLPLSEDKETQNKQTNHFIRIFEKQTFLSEKQIFALNNITLNARQLLKLGIATNLMPLSCRSGIIKLSVRYLYGNFI